MTIEFTPLTVLIGGNSSGKSTVLQALDFLRSTASRDIPEYLREKGWQIEELKSQINGGQNKPIEFISDYEFLINKKKETIRWHMQINQEKGNWIIREKMENLSINKVLYSSDFGKTEINKFNLQSSWLKYYMDDKNLLLRSLKMFLSESIFFGLLSPDSIRKGNGQMSAENIGINGITLFPFLHNMASDDRKSLNKTVSELVDFSLEIETVDVGKIESYIDEKSNNIETRINKDNISDGLLRIIAFVTLSLEKKTNNPASGFILLDEIEDGMNPYLAEKIVKLFETVTKKSNRQVIVTTHSPVLLDYINPKNIIFLWKGKDLAIYNKKMFSAKRMKELLEALNPGEVWVNLEKSEMLERMGAK